MNVLSLLPRRSITLPSSLILAVCLPAATGCRDSILPPGVDARASRSGDAEPAPDPSPAHEKEPVDSAEKTA
jgi:hypothetical protein